MDPFLTSQIITYMGNKRKLLPTVRSIIESIQEKEGKSNLTIGDGFSGSGIVSRLFKQHASSLYSNDIADYSYIINECYLSNLSCSQISTLEKHIKDANIMAESHVNGDTRCPSFISGHWAPLEETIRKDERVYFTYENGRRIDAYRHYIDTIPEPYKSLLLGRLLVEVSIHNNTNGQFSAYYKNSEKIGHYGGKHEIDLQRIAKSIILTMPILHNNKKCKVHVTKKDTTQWAKSIKEPLDLIYYDPPYNKHPYSIYYFLLNIVASWDKTIEIPDSNRGQPIGWHRSAYNSFKHAEKEFEDLIGHTKSKYILISYNSGGIIPIENMGKILQKYGNVTTIPVEHKTYNRLRGISEYKRTTEKAAIKEFFWLVTTHRED